MVRNFVVLPEETGKRVDVFLADKMGEGFSRAFIQKAISQNGAFLNQVSVKAHRKVASGDAVSISLPEDKPAGISAEKINFKIIYEDEDVLVIDKPSGLVVHPGSGNQSGTLVNGLLMHTENLSSINPLRPGIVHRLDKETSGVMVAAKNNPSHLNLAKQFARHSIKRKYAALVRGVMELDEGIIDLPLGRNSKDFRRQAVSFINSKEALTRYKVVRRFKDATFLELTPETGRTHQLRVHLAHIGYPILGDSKYGRPSDFPRLGLHAQELGFRHPGSKNFMSFSSPLPAEFLGFIKSETY